MSEPPPPPPPNPPEYDDDAIDRLGQSLDADAPSAESAEPKQVGRYRIVERVGEGGMGTVYKAQQSSPIERTVALKLIKFNTPEIVRRFQAERQALAWMDHPNIAKVLDAGAAPVTGQPYFVMEFVPGEPITKYCDSHQLDNRQRLELMLEVCDAVAHAHQKLMVHRDLKPSNILVYEDANRSAHAKVIDFGVAKAMAQNGDDFATLHTEAGAIIGTPDYMSPEQARVTGAARDVDTRSDIYSLGVVLYELITGALPFDPATLRAEGIAGVERIICTVDPPRPSQRLTGLGAGAIEVARQHRSEPAELERQLKTELEWIPLKAMRKNREERYSTVTEFADDIRNYLAGRPLIAAPESRAYRARKFLRRNRLAVSVVALIALLLVGGIVGTSWQAARAERQRKIAEARFDDIRLLASKLIFEIHADVAKLPGSQPAVNKLLGVALDYLKKLDADSSTDISVIRDASIGYQHLGDMQGNQYNNNRGDIKAATASYEKARDLANRALKLQPNDPDSLTALAGAELKLGDVAEFRADYPSALPHYGEGEKLMEQVAQQKPSDFRARANVLTALQRIAGSKAAGNNVGDAITEFDKDLSIAHQLVADFPKDDNAKSILCGFLQATTDLRQRRGDLNGAYRDANELLSINEALAKAEPNDVGQQIDVASALEVLSRVLESQKKTNEALTLQKRGLDVAQIARERDPDNIRVRQHVASAEVRFAELSSAAGQHDEAMRAFDQAEELYRGLLKVAPNDRTSFQMLLYTLSSQATAFSELNRNDEALARLKEVITTLEPAVAAGPKDTALAGGLAFVNQQAGEVLRKSKKTEESMPYTQRAIELNTRLNLADPNNAQIAKNLLRSRLDLGEAFAVLNRIDDARSQYQSAREMFLAMRDRKMQIARDELLKEIDDKIAALSQPATAPATAASTTESASPK